MNSRNRITFLYQDLLRYMYQQDKNVGKDIVEIIKAEQSAELEAMKESVEIAKADSEKQFKLHVITLIISSLITITMCLISAYLMLNGSEIGGSVFAGATFLAVVRGFLSFSQKKQISE